MGRVSASEMEGLVISFFLEKKMHVASETCFSSWVSPLHVFLQLRGAVLLVFLKWLASETLHHFFHLFIIVGHFPLASDTPEFYIHITFQSPDKETIESRWLST